MSDSHSKPSQLSDPGEQGVQKPKRTPTFDDILNPPPKPNNDLMQVPLGDQECRLHFLDAPKPPEKTPLYSPYRGNDVISATQLFKNRPYLKVPTVPYRRAIIPPRKPVNVAMTSNPLEPEARASIDATGTSGVNLSASGDQENIQVPAVAQIASPTSCARPQHTDNDDRSCKTNGAVPAAPGQLANHAECESAHSTRTQETKSFVLELNELKNKVKSLLVEITEKHDPVSRESREDYAMYRGRVLNSREIQDYLLMKASQKHTGLAESRILRREAGVLDGLNTQAQKVSDMSRHFYQNSELSREVAEIFKAVDALCDAASSQGSASMAVSTPPRELPTMRSIAIDAAMTCPTSRRSLNSGAASTPLGGDIQHLQQLMGIFAERKMLQAQNNDLLSQVESLQLERGRVRKHREDATDFV